MIVNCEGASSRESCTIAFMCRYIPGVSVLTIQNFLVQRCPHPGYTDPDKSESHTAKATIATGCIESDHVMIDGGHGDVYSQNPTCLTCRSAQAGAEKKLYTNSGDWIPESNTRSKSVLNNRNLPLPPAIL